MGIQRKCLILLVAEALLLVSSFCPETFYQHGNICCRLCSKGTYLSHPCTEDRGSSSCEACPASTFMDHNNNNSQCQTCTKCEPSQIELEKCEAKKNTKCGCPRGKFHNSHYLFCMDCKKCLVGEGVVRPCLHDSDTKCEPCPKGTFSDLESFEKKCIKCTKCEPAGIMIVKEECNASRDTICERTNVTLHLITSSQSFASATLQQVYSSVTSNPHQITVKTSSQYKYIIAIVSVGFIICVFVAAFLCFVLKRRRSGGTCADTSHTQEVCEREYHFPVPATAGSETPAQLRSSQGLRGRRNHHSRNSIHRKESESPQDENNGKNKMLVRDLPGHIFIELGRLLNPKSFNNWAKLAGLLGFTSTHVQNFGLEPEEATQNLLNEWGQQEGSTVDVLIDIFKEMKRDDCLQVLKEWNSSS